MLLVVQNKKKKEEIIQNNLFSGGTRISAHIKHKFSAHIKHFLFALKFHNACTNDIKGTFDNCIGKIRR